MVELFHIAAIPTEDFWTKIKLYSYISQTSATLANQSFFSPQQIPNKKLVKIQQTQHLNPLLS